MGFSTVAASTILFVAFLLFASILTGAFFEAQREVSDATRDDRDRAEFERATNITVKNGNHASGTLNLNLTNTGGSVLDVAKVALFVDGTWATDTISSSTVDGATTDVWAPGQVLYIKATQASEPQRAFVVLETGRGILWTP